MGSGRRGLVLLWFPCWVQPCHRLGAAQRPTSFLASGPHTSCLSPDRPSLPVAQSATGGGGWTRRSPCVPQMVRGGKGRKASFREHLLCVPITVLTASHPVSHAARALLKRIKVVASWQWAGGLEGNGRQRNPQLHAAFLGTPFFALTPGLPRAGLRVFSRLGWAHVPQQGNQPAGSGSDGTLHGGRRFPATRRGLHASGD